MTTATLFNYMDLLRQGGFTEQQSKAQARALEAILVEVKQEIKQEVNFNDLATKGDVHRIELSIEKVRYDALKFTIWTGVGVIASLGGLMISLLGKGFHWF